MKVSILLPYKENYSKEYAGAVSIFVNGINSNSKFKSSTKIYGNTNFKNYLSNNYVNIPFKKKLFKSSSKIYVENFIKYENKRKSNIIEIHNRPTYLKYFLDLKKKNFVFYFHNDPLSMTGSTSTEDRMFILNFCKKIIFNSEWTKKRFFTDIDNFYHNSEKVEVIYQSTSRVKVNLNQKKKIITFVGRLNSSKGYDLFGKAIIRILNKFDNWSAYVFGDEPREKLLFYHKRLFKLGYQSNNKVLKLLKKTSIAVACSKWDEPFGRSSLEASSRGCAVIISRRGGLPETITNGIILDKLNVNSLYLEIKKLIQTPKKLKKIQSNSIKNFYLDNKFICNKIDIYRYKLINSFKHNNLNNKIKILHITNFNERHNGRLFYNTGRRINNGFIKLGHTVQTLSDRDIVSNERKITDYSGSKTLNNKLIDIVGNFIPDMIVFGHADQIFNSSLMKIKEFYPSVKICQWFLDRMDNNNWIINKNRFQKKIPFLDASFCTTHPSAINLLDKSNVWFMPNPVDKMFDNLNVYKNKYFKYDLFFAMSHGVHRGTLKKGKIDKREEFINKLTKHGNEIRYNLHGFNNNQPIWSEEFKLKLKTSKMALNLSQGDSIKFYSSDRIAQLIGNGILTFVDIKTQLNKILTDKEVVFFKNHKDLYNKIMILKDNNALRIKIAKSGMIKYHKFINSTLVAEYIIYKTFSHKYKKKYLWENK